MISREQYHQYSEQDVKLADSAQPITQTFEIQETLQAIEVFRMENSLPPHVAERALVFIPFLSDPKSITTTSKVLNISPIRAQNFIADVYQQPDLRKVIDLIEERKNMMHETANITENIDDFFNQYINRLEKELSPEQKKLLRTVQKSKHMKPVMKMLGLSRAQTSEHVSKLRNYIFNNFPLPEHIKPIAFYKNSSVTLAASRKTKFDSERRLSSYKFLNTIYTTDEAVEEYLKTKRNSIPQEYIDLGYVKAVDHLSYNELGVLKKPKYNNIKIIVNGLILILPENLEKFRQLRTPPGDEYEPVSKVAQNAPDHEREMKRLNMAIYRGSLTARKFGGQNYVLRKDVIEYKNQKTGDVTNEKTRAKEM